VGLLPSLVWPFDERTDLMGFLLSMHVLPGVTIADIATFFNNLQADVVAFALAASAFFFTWAAILYMSAGENERRLEQAKHFLYSALAGLALALLAVTITGLINTAAAGQ
jgi:hypothetical protein